MMEVHFAPLQGYADSAYRLLHSQLYGGVDCYYTPFIRVERGEPRPQDMRRLADSRDHGYQLVPQIIFGSVDEFSMLVDAIANLGFRRIDLNLGCPYTMQTKKGRGAAMVSRIDIMSRVADLINADENMCYSVKMRLGLNEPNEWQSLMSVLNSMRLVHVTVHPRVAKQMYAGELHREQFNGFLEQSSNPVIWNGDMLTVDDINAVQQSYPTLKGVMIGRGLLCRPSLAVEWRTSHEWTEAERLAKLIKMHASLLAEYESTLCGPTQILQKIKPFWDYLEPEIGYKTAKAIRKASSLSRYREAVASVGG